MNCKNCGTFVNQNDEFCMKCGNKLKETTTQNQPNSYAGLTNNGVPVNNQNQPMFSNNPSSNYNPVQNYVVPNKKNNKLIILILGICLLVAAGVIIYMVFFNKDNNLNEDNNDNSTVATSDWETVTFEDYKIDIYKDMQYSYDYDEAPIVVGNENLDFLMMVSHAAVTYSQSYESRSNLISGLKTKFGLTYRKDYEKTAQNKKVYIIEGVTNSNNYGALAITKLDTANIAVAIMAAKTEAIYNANLNRFLISLVSVRPNSSYSSNITPSNDLIIEGSLKDFKLD